MYCGANRLAPRTGSADKLAINVSIDIHTNQHSSTVSPTQGVDPRPQPPARPRSRSQARPLPTPIPAPALAPAPAPTTVVVSITLPATSATKKDYDDVAEVTTNIVIENTDLTSLAGWFPKLVLVTSDVQITNM